MRFPRFAFLALLSFLLCAAASRAAAAADRSPFIERVRPVDFYDVEKFFPEQYSRAYDFVMLRTTAEKPVSVLAIKPATGGEAYTITLQLASADAPDGWLKISEDLDAAVAKQVLRAIEFKLHRQVALSDFKRKMSKTDTDVWLFQRLADNRVAAALIASEVAMDNPAATAFVDDFLGNLQRLIGAEGDARNELLQKIDRTATEINLAESR